VVIIGNKTPSTLDALMRSRPPDHRLELHVHLCRDLDPERTRAAITRLEALSPEPEKTELLPGGLVFLATTAGCIQEIAGIPEVEWLSLPARPATLEELLDEPG
jgi:hypothetical protein